MYRIAYGVAVLSASVLLGACSAEPPTITPAPDAQSEQGSTSIVMTIEAPDGAGAAVIEIEVPGITLPATAPYRAPEGAFSLDLPIGWPEERQPVGQTDVTVGTYFQPPARNEVGLPSPLSWKISSAFSRRVVKSSSGYEQQRTV